MTESCFEFFSKEAAKFGGTDEVTLENDFFLNFVSSCSDFIVKSSAYAEWSSKPSGNSTRTAELPSETRKAFRSGWVERESSAFWFCGRSGKRVWSLSLNTGMGGLDQNEMKIFVPANVEKIIFYSKIFFMFSSLLSRCQRQLDLNSWSCCC